VCLLRLPARQDARGTLLLLEFSELPFVPQRAFVTRVGEAGVQRGGHAHKRCRQILICLAGVIEVEVAQAGKTASVHLETDQALLIEPPVWSRQAFVGPDAQLLVLTSEPYDPDDYLEQQTPAPAVR
jgi:dTDP-4-dehydrorhamnose 3,5-epimerase-like enzyme